MTRRQASDALRRFGWRPQSWIGIGNRTPIAAESSDDATVEVYVHLRERETYNNARERLVKLAMRIGKLSPAARAE